MAFEAWTAERSAAWDSAPFQPTADTLAEIHERLIALLPPIPGEQWLEAFHRAYVAQLDRYRTNGQVRFPREHLITIGQRKETHA
jgi:putative SOS response-associated peptidase YedK